MIPRHRSFEPAAQDSDRPELPPIIHHATDIDVTFQTGERLSLTITDGDGTLTEHPDRYVFEQAGENVTIWKPACAYFRRRERTFLTAPEPFQPHPSE
jgi:hypothetical protein